MEMQLAAFEDLEGTSHAAQWAWGCGASQIVTNCWIRFSMKLIESWVPLEETQHFEGKLVWGWCLTEVKIEPWCLFRCWSYRRGPLAAESWPVRSATDGFAEFICGVKPC